MGYLWLSPRKSKVLSGHVLLVRSLLIAFGRPNGGGGGGLVSFFQNE
jgi:hypothetical protein